MSKTIELHPGKTYTEKVKAKALPEVLNGVGRPVAFYPALVPLLGSVNAVLLFCQLFYWHYRSFHGYTYKVSKEIKRETGLTYAQQRTAREKLRSLGVLFEHHARLQHEMHYTLDLKPLAELWSKYQETNSEMSA